MKNKTKIHHYIQRCFIIFILLFLLSLQAVAEKFRFGKISKTELEMITFPDALEAASVYLFDIGNMHITSGLRMILKRHVRIKILTEEGKKQANVRLPYWKKDWIHSIQGHTILSSGKRIKLAQKAIHEERFENTKQKVFSLPGVEMGAVIEYQYTYESEYLHFLEPWYFQQQEYTCLSRLSLIFAPGFSYNVFLKNATKLESTEEYFLAVNGQRLKRYIYQMKNIPPVIDEPYIRAISDYWAVAHFQLIAYRNSSMQINYVLTWSDLIEKQREYYWPFRKNYKNFQKWVMKLLPDSLSQTEKMIALYHEVTNHIRTTTRGNIYLKKYPRNVLTDLKGSGSEKNLLLINLLNAAGIEAHPLLISTRGHGKLVLEMPFLQQFDYLLAYVKIDHQIYILDTCDNYYPYDMLPIRNIVEKGLLIKAKGKGRFIKIPSPTNLNMIHCKTEARLTRDGILMAATRIRYEGYRAIAARKGMSEEGEAGFIKEELKNRFENVEIDSFQVISRAELVSPLYVNVFYKVPEFAEFGRGKTYISSPVLFKFTRNLFKREKRCFPVEFQYKYSTTDKIILTFPQAVKIIEIPPSIMNRDKDIRFKSFWKVEGNKIMLQRQYIRTKLLFSPDQYPTLRKLYDLMVKADNSPMVVDQKMSSKLTN